MARLQDGVLVRATHRFDASAERVYDAFLDPSRAAKFLFATPTGQIVRCEIDACLGGTNISEQHFTWRGEKSDDGKAWSEFMVVEVYRTDVAAPPGFHRGGNGELECTRQL